MGDGAVSVGVGEPGAADGVADGDGGGTTGTVTCNEPDRSNCSVSLIGSPPVSGAVRPCRVSSGVVTPVGAWTPSHYAAQEKRLKAQFAAMETALNQSQTQQSWLTGQLNALNN